MSKLQDANAAKQSTINVLLVVIVGLFMTIFYQMRVNALARDNFTITIPPDLRHGAIVRPDEYGAAAVYSFVKSTFRELYRWEVNGKKDYPRKIEELSPRFTAEYKEFLENDANERNLKGQLENRTRHTLEAPGEVIYTMETANLVEPRDKGEWLVTLTLTAVDRSENFEVRRTTIEYPLLVRLGNISPEKNIWGLVLAGYPADRKPRTVSIEEIEIETLAE